MKKVMLMLVGGRQAANALGILCYRPDEVGFLVSRNRPQDYQMISEFCRAIPSLTLLEPKWVDAFSMEEVASICEELFDEHAGNEVVLNVTTGTTIMSIGGYEASKRCGIKAIYIATAIRRIIALTGADEPEIELRITIPHYLSVYGRSACPRFRFSDLSIPETSAVEMGTLLTTPAARECLILMRRWNRGKDKRTIRGGIKSTLDEGVRDVFCRLQNSGLIQELVIDDEKVSYQIPCEANWKFLDGTWLEVLCWHTARSLRDDDGTELFTNNEVMFSMVIPSSTAVSELDLLCLRHGQLIIASCKTEEHSFKTRYLDELQARADMLGGRFCGRLFVTNQPSPVSDSERQDYERFVEQATAREIVLVNGDHLSDLNKYLKDEVIRPRYPRL